MSRLGEFTIDGSIFVTSAGANTEGNYLFDATARTAVGNADFVIVSATIGTTAATLRFDCQGDGGSGSLLASGTGTSTAKNVVWSLHVGRQIILPASLFGTSDTTRTGRLISSTASTLVYFQFCSWV